MPIVFGVALLLAIDPGALADEALAFTAVLLLAALCVGFAEEGMFRGLTVTALRTNGLREARVALWSSVTDPRRRCRRGSRSRTSRG